MRPGKISVRYAHVSAACATLVFLTGALALVGWEFRIGWLKSMRADWIAMKANTALFFCVAGLSLWSLQPARFGPRSAPVARGAAAAVLLIGLVSLLENLFGWNFGLDELLFDEPAGAVATMRPGLMAPATALSFALTGLALWLAGRRRAVEAGRTRAELWQGVLLVVGLIAFLAIVGYFYGVAPLTGWPYFTPMAVHTAGAFLLLSLGGLCLRPRDGFMTLISSDAAGSRMLRRLLLPVVAVPLVLGWLRSIGEWARLYDTALGVSVMVVSTIIILVMLLAAAARWLNRTDAERLRAELEIRQLNEGLERRVRERTAALSNSEARFRATVETAQDPVVMMDSHERITLWNEAAVRVFGYSREEALGQPLHELLAPHPYREQIARALPAWQQTGTGAIVGTTRELPALRKDGQEIATELSVSSILMNREWHAVGIVRDITARKRAEEEVRRLNAELEQRVHERTAQLEASNKELEAFSYSVSHDLRAPLRHMDGFVKLLQKRVGERLDDTSSRYLHVIAGAAAKMGQLIDDLLAFSRTGRADLRMGRVPLNALVEAARAELAPVLAGRRVTWHIGELPTVLGDPHLLQLVWVNLLSNAIKYSSQRPEALIEIGARPADDGYVIIFVRDNGVGFDPQYADKLFGVFQRLHRAGEFEGTGIGLATVRRIIHRHGGEVWAEGVPEQGATFSFSLRAV